MSETKDDAISELDEQQLSSVSGGVGVAGAADSVQPAATPASDSTSGKVQHKDFTFSHLIDKASSL